MTHAIDTKASTPTNSAIDSLAAPATDGGILIEPSMDRLLTAAKANRERRREFRFDLAGRPVREWIDDRVDAGAPLVVMTGHQPELIHAGVWIKQVVASRLAARLGGRSTFLVVDSDVPGSVRFSWPELRERSLEVHVARAAGVKSNQSYEDLRDENGFDGSAIVHAMRKAGDGGPSPLSIFAAAFDMTDDAAHRGYVDRWITAMRACDEALGLPGTDYPRISALFDVASPVGDAAAAAFVAHLLSNASEFRQSYNSALADYRRRRGIAGRQHPVPDLASTNDRLELPFWISHPARGRGRMYVVRDSGRHELWVDDVQVGPITTRDLLDSPTNALAGALGEWRIRPRALAQTMYARLFACDLFLHGIGGAKYDQMTDDIVRRFFGIEPPAYGCVTATLRLPLPVFDATNDDLARARHATRDVRYNPQRYVTNGRRATIEAELRDRAAAIDTSVRLRDERSADRTARRATYDRIRSANATILRQVPAIREEREARFERLERELAHNRIAMNREWFFALHGVDRLLKLRDDASSDARNS